MKRLYVRPDFLAQGIGRQLARTVIVAARQAGYDLMCLDTLERLEPALALYQDLGFVRRSAYYENPLPEVVYLELEL
jgi:ribosomal protein S18 acetylase RimI-like enzyme